MIDLSYHNSDLINFYKSSGVIFIDEDSVYISKEVKIESGAIIHPMVVLNGNTTIKKGAQIFPFSDLTDTVVEEYAEVRSTYAVGAIIGANSTVGPFATLRKGAVIGPRSRVGDYVEVKNSQLGAGVKVAHLAYVGDAEVGDLTNIVCGTVFANYNGKIKQKVSVGKGVFIGCNSNLVAPLSICDGAFIAAGSTVTKDIPKNGFCVARAREYIKSDWNNNEKEP